MNTQAAMEVLAKAYIADAEAMLELEGVRMSKRQHADTIQELVYHQTRQLPEQIEAVVAKLLKGAK